jgi:hypothetical protein
MGIQIRHGGGQSQEGTHGCALLPCEVRDALAEAGIGCFGGNLVVPVDPIESVQSYTIFGGYCAECSRDRLSTIEEQSFPK